MSNVKRCVLRGFIFTVAALVRLRRREPDLPRPFRVPLYPLPPLVFALLSALALALTAWERPLAVGAGVGLLPAHHASGFPDRLVRVLPEVSRGGGAISIVYPPSQPVPASASSWVLQPLLNRITGTRRPACSRFKPATIFSMYCSENSR